MSHVLEGTLSNPYGYYAELALNSPKISVNDPRVIKYLSELNYNPHAITPLHSQFGNNFVLLFMSMDNDDQTNSLVRTYRRNGEKLGLPWRTFLGENETLLGDIQTAVHGLRPYSELLGAFISLLRDKHQDLAEKLNIFAAHPLGVEAIGIHAWDRLNPLMETASQRMTTGGIDPRQFYR